ncbi:MAG TPA: AAA family ATPase [Pirellulales bacterium]|nr:AAA family ATPase [Pirellulales bacterium]
MADYEQQLLAIAQQIDDRWWLSEIALFAEHSLLAADREKARALLERRAKETLGSLPAAELHRRRWGWPYQLRQAEIAVPAPPRDAFWQSEVILKFDYLNWSPSPDAHLAYVPALDIEVLQPRAGRLEAAVATEIRSALERFGATASLEKLVRLARRSKLELAETSVTVRLPTPKERALRELEQDDEESSVLKQAAVELSSEPLAEAFEADAAVSQLAELLAGPSPRSVLLVGPAGVGKTAAVYQLVRERRRRGLAGAAFWATSGARLVAGMSGFGMWQERCRDLCREAAKKKAVVYLGNLIELAQVGQCISQSESIASFLRPYLVRGDLTAVTECTPEQLALLERDAPQLLQAFVTIRVEEPTRERGRLILERQAAASAARLDAAAIDVLDRLHRRYAGYSAYPGRPLRLLKNLCHDAPPGSVVSVADVTRAFSRVTGLPRRNMRGSGLPLLSAASTCHR